MTTFVSSLMTAVGIGTAAAATETVVIGATGATFTVTAGGTAAAAAGGLSALEIIGGGLTAFSALTAIAGGEIQAKQAEGQANFEKFNAGLAVTEGMQRENDVTRQLLQTLGAQRTGLGAAGFDVTGNTMIERNAVSQANRDKIAARRRAGLEVASRRQRATALAGDAAAYRVGGAANAGSAVANHLNRGMARG